MSYLLLQQRCFTVCWLGDEPLKNHLTLNHSYWNSKLIDSVHPFLFSSWQSPWEGFINMRYYSHVDIIIQFFLKSCFSLLGKLWLLQSVHPEKLPNMEAQMETYVYIASASSTLHLSTLQEQFIP